MDEPGTTSMYAVRVDYARGKLKNDGIYTASHHKYRYPYVVLNIEYFRRSRGGTVYIACPSFYVCFRTKWVLARCMPYKTRVRFPAREPQGTCYRYPPITLPPRNALRRSAPGKPARVLVCNTMLSFNHRAYSSRTDVLTSRHRSGQHS